MVPGAVGVFSQHDGAGEDTINRLCAGGAAGERIRKPRPRCAAERARRSSLLCLTGSPVCAVWQKAYAAMEAIAAEENDCCANGSSFFQGSAQKAAKTENDYAEIGENQRKTGRKRRGANPRRKHRGTENDMTDG